MNKKLIVVQGYLAAGKSTFARNLSQVIHVPCIVKDTFKMAICRNISIADRSESILYSEVTFDAMMYVAERMFETGSPVMIEGNFVPAGVKRLDEADVIRQLTEKYGYASLTFQFKGDIRVLYRRFTEREKTAERGQANKIGFDLPYGIFEEWCRNLGPFHIGGKTVSVDTTDFSTVDFPRYIEMAREFMVK